MSISHTRIINMCMPQASRLACAGSLAHWGETPSLPSVRTHTIVEAARRAVRLVAPTHVGQPHLDVAQVGDRHVIADAELVAYLCMPRMGRLNTRRLNTHSARVRKAGWVGTIALPYTLECQGAVVCKVG